MTCATAPRRQHRVATHAIQQKCNGEPAAGITIMKISTPHALTVAALLAVSGCKSGPSWAWWKPEGAPADTSAVARSAETPQLPSAQAALPVNVPGLQPATPPSAANLASATTPAAAGTQTAITSPLTVASAPLANYPSVDTAADKLTAPSTAFAPNTATTPVSPSSPLTAGMQTGAVPQMAATAAPPSGPYDPNGYRPSTDATPLNGSAVAQTTPPTGSYSSLGSRYGSVATAETTPVASAPLATAEMPSTPQFATSPAPTVGGRYGLGASSPTPSAHPTDIGVARSPMETAPSTPVASNSPSTVSSLVAPAPTTPVVNSAVVSSATGQYRPGGTSTYQGTTPGHVEVAARPAPVSTPTTTAPSYAPAGTSVPWSPAGTTPQATGTQRY
jgi:hypothetical protein